MIAAACESAEKVIADTRKAYFGTRQGPTILPTLDKAQAAKIHEQENLLRSAVNHGEGVILKHYKFKAIKMADRGPKITTDAFCLK